MRRGRNAPQPRSSSAERELVRHDDKIALLFTPPFDMKTGLEPGYIKGYPPGLRENGGQYTHAAIWLVWALALQGEGDKAARLFAMLNPIGHSANKDDADLYKVEPYVVTADIYSAPGHVGRGGWTWYTGSAGWLYRCGVEVILGLRKVGESLEIDPCIPSTWPSFRMTLRYGASSYTIEIKNPAGVQRGVKEVLVDGLSTPNHPARVPIVDDGRDHGISVTLG